MGLSFLIHLSGNNPLKKVVHSLFDWSLISLCQGYLNSNALNASHQAPECLTYGIAFGNGKIAARADCG
jgi:hypothetical protein